MEQTDKRKIRLVVVGDEFVGKSSLISSIFSEVPTNVERTLRRVILPPDMCKFSKETFTQLIDTSLTETDLEAEFNNSDLAIVVYDVSSESSIENLTQKWLPLIRREAPHLPVMLVGNKTDKIESKDKSYTKVYDIIRRVKPVFSQVQMGVECSAYYGRRVQTVLENAQRVVLYPIAILYDSKNKQLSPKFQQVLKRIFRILDKDMDGKLSDQELATLQERVFKSSLTSEDIRFIKDIIDVDEEQSQNQFITEKGFLSLNKKCIQTLKLQIPWNILKHFKYNNKLQLKFLKEGFHINNQESLEFTSTSLHFLHKLYSFAVRADNKQPIKLIFQCSPLAPPLPQFQLPFLTLENFLYAWNYLAFIDYQECYRNLYAIGYEQRISTTFKLTQGKGTYSELCRLKQRKILGVAFIETPQTAQYLGDLFVSSQQDQLLHRKYKVINLDGSSKVLLLFKISIKNVEEFCRSALARKYLSLYDRIDLLITFKDQKDPSSQINKLRQLINSQSLLIRQILITQQQNIQSGLISILGLNCLDLQSLPVRYRPESYDKLFKIVSQSLSKIQLCLPTKTVIQLKSKEKKQKLLVILGLTAVIAGVVGLYYINKK